MGRISIRIQFICRVGSGSDFFVKSNPGFVKCRTHFHIGLYPDPNRVLWWTNRIRLFCWVGPGTGLSEELHSDTISLSRRIRIWFLICWIWLYWWVGPGTVFFLYRMGSGESGPGFLIDPIRSSFSIWLPVFTLEDQILIKSLSTRIRMQSSLTGSDPSSVQ